MTTEDAIEAEMRGEIERLRAELERKGESIENRDDLLRDLRAENAELRGEVERLRELVRANASAVLTFERERNSARAQLAAAQAQLAEANSDFAKVFGKAVDANNRANAAEARLEAVRALCVRWEAERTYLNAEQEPIAAAYIELLDAAMPAAPQPEPERVEPDSPLGRLFDYLTQPEPPASDEPARCEHGFTAWHWIGGHYSTGRWSDPPESCPGPTASPR